MKKIQINEKINYHCDWLYTVSLNTIKKDIVKLEELGVTDIEIDLRTTYNNSYIEIQPVCLRLETDEEFEERKLQYETIKNAKIEKEKKEFYRLKEKLNL